MNLSLIEAFARFGAKPSHKHRALSAIAPDGAMVLNCSKPYFRHPSHGVLRYEDKLSRESDETRNVELGRHLTLAHEGALPVRMVVASPADERGRGPTFHVRLDLVGKVVKFDGDHFIVDFIRQQPEVSHPRI